MKKILLNASQKEEVRLAVIDDNKLIDLDIDFPSRNIKSNIYKGTISRVEPSLEAAFVNFGRTRHGFLPFKEISPEIFSHTNKSSRDCLESGKEIIIQVDKEERGNKGAALTTYLSLAGKYLVLLPKNPSTGGISRRIEGEDRIKAKKLMESLEIPEGMSVILRTSSLEASNESVKWDIEYLIQIYESVLETSVQQTAPFLIYQESSMMARMIRDYCDETIDEVYIDDKKFFDNFISAKKLFMPHHEIKTEHHSDLTPIFSAHKIERQVQTVYKRNINLPSGGNIVIDSTEALVSIDVNSARSTKGSDIEDTAQNTNIEAAVEILTQLKLRDIGGLVVIDFIDMMSINSQKNVMRKVAEYAKKDKAKIAFARISKFGLMELSRQKLKSSIIQNNYETCPTCDGTGQIKSLSTLAISLLRIIEEESMNAKEKQTVYLPVRLATFLLNEKKDTIQNIESRHKVDIKIVPDPDLDASSYEIDNEGLSESDFKEQLKQKNKNQRNNKKTDSSADGKIIQDQEIALMSAVTPKSAPPKPKRTYRNTTKSTTNIFKRIFNLLFGNKEEEKSARPKRYYNKNRRYNKNYKYNKYKSNNRRNYTKNSRPKNNQE
ncbi:Rne/Rng family ribonuclease [Gammaproteobacteria bacterium]|nr:Rne/Rng family ribonuclease [Gammaproteobacteria bacterium]